jgi:U4/U6 small nuclear ribonucleoprotein PRP31
MSGLADELLADLEDHSGAEEQEDKPDSNDLKRKAVDSDHDMSADEEEEDDGSQPDDPDDKRLEVGALVLEGGIKPAEELDVEDVQRMELGAIEDVNKIAKLEGSKRMTDILKVCPSSSSDSILTVCNTGNRKIPS